MFKLICGTAAALGLALVWTSSAAAQAAPAPADQARPVPLEPYLWKSVTIKGNGFIDGIVFSRAQKGLVYMHTDMGGAYRYDPDQKQWVCLTDWAAWNDNSLNSMGVETMAADPTDAHRVYIGMGTYMGPSAVLGSDDQGRTWQRTNVPFPMNGNGNGRNCGERMNVDPNSPNILIYGTRNMGLWKSTDRAATWARVDSFPTTGDEGRTTRDVGIVWTLFDPTSGARGTPTPTIYAGVCTASPQKVFRSTDAGATWQPLPGQPTVALPADPEQPDAQLSPTRAVLTPDGKTLYLTYIIPGAGAGPYGATGGAVFRCANPASAQPTWTDITPLKGRFGWSGITLDPTDPNTLLASVIDRYNPVDDIYRTTDGGKTWSGLESNAHRDDSSAPYAKNQGMHWMGDVEIDPFDRNHAMYTTGFGLYDTRELAQAHPVWTFFNDGFEQSAALELVSPPAGTAHLLSAIGDRDGYRHDDFAVSPVHGALGSEQKMTLGSVQQIALAWNRPDTVVRAGGGRTQYSLDGGLTWHWFEKPAADQQGWRGGFGRGTIAVSADGTHAVYTTGQGMTLATRTADGFTTWQPAASGPKVAPPPAPSTAPTTQRRRFRFTRTYVTADLVNPQRFYLLFGDELYGSQDAGLNWEQVGTLPAGLRWMRPVFGHEGHLWAACGSDGVARSSDGGKTWQRVAADVVTVANTLGIGAPAPGRDYPAVFISGLAGGQPGYFRSDDQGAAWVRINDDQHQFGAVTVIQGDPRVYGRLYIGSNGRGIIYGDRQR